MPRNARIGDGSGDGVRGNARLPRRSRHDGFSQGMSPVVPLDPRRIGSVDDLVRGMGKASFGARQVGEAADP